MADTKITSLLTPQVTTNPATDVLPIVNIADTSMASSGSTRKITVNTLLGAGGTATLASATITGDLTVDTSTLKVDSTNNRVGILTATPRVSLDVASGNGYVSGQFDFGGTGPGANAQGFLSYSGGNAIVGSYGNTSLLFYTNGAEQMRLNATGLGVGGTIATSRLQAAAANAATASWGISSIYSTDSMAVDKGGSLVFGGSFTGSSTTYFAQVAGRKENSTDSDVAGYLAFSTRPTGGLTTERLRIDSSGNVGIGVTPSVQTAGFRALEINSKGNGLLSYSNDNVFLNENTYFDGAWKYATVARAAQYAIFQGSHRWYYDTGTQAVGTNINSVQAMTLDASGNLLVNTTSQVLSAKVSLQTAGTRGYSYNDSTGGAGTKAIIFGSLGVEVGSVSTTTASTTYNTLSDYRLKEAVQPLVGGLARVSALKPSIYKWKSNGSSGEGFLAHELAEVVPAAVTGEKDAVNEDGTVNPQGVDMSRIVPILVAAIQELAAEVNALKKA